MTEAKTAKFQPHGQIQLIEPSALGLDFILMGNLGGAPFELVADGKAAVVTVRGPLSYESFMFDSYSAIKARVAEAAKSEAEIVLLRISSPGGDVAGAFDCARAVRKIIEDAGKTYIAYSDSDACSAAYALMCTANEACASTSAKIGSIGAVAQYVDQTAADKAQGLLFTTLTTGERKADGNPHITMSDDTKAALQEMLGQAGDQFYGLVAAHRPLSVDKIRGLQAGVFMGPAAKSIGLIDDLYSWEELLERIQNSSTIQESKPQTEAKLPFMPDDSKDKDKDSAKALRASLESAAKAGDKAASRALKAYDSDGDNDEDKKAKAESDEKDVPPEKEKKAKAESSDEKKDDEKDAKAMAAQVALEAKDAALAASNARIKALEDAAHAREKAEAEKAANEFYASRPDLPASLVEKLRKLPLDQAKAIAETVPVAFTPAVPNLAKKPAQGGRADGISANAELNAKMGLGHVIKEVPHKYEGGVQVLYSHEFGLKDPE